MLKSDCNNNNIKKKEKKGKNIKKKKQKKKKKKKEAITWAQTHILRIDRPLSEPLRHDTDAILTYI